MNKQSRFLRKIHQEMIIPRLSYNKKYYLSEKFYKKVSPKFAKTVEDYLTSDGGILYKTEEAFIAAKKPVEYI